MHIMTASDKENNNNALNKIIKSGITFGSTLAMVISYAACLLYDGQSFISCLAWCIFGLFCYKVLMKICINVFVMRLTSDNSTVVSRLLFN